MTPKETLALAYALLTGPRGDSHCAATAIWSVATEDDNALGPVSLRAAALLADAAGIDFDPNAAHYCVWHPIYRWNDALTRAQVLSTMKAAMA